MALERWPADGVPDNPGSLDHHDGPQPGDRPIAPRSDLAAARAERPIGMRALESHR